MGIREAASELRRYIGLLNNHRVVKLGGNDGYFAIVRKAKTKLFPIDFEKLEELGFTYSHTNTYLKTEEVIIRYKK